MPRSSTKTDARAGRYRRPSKRLLVVPLLTVLAQLLVVANPLPARASAEPATVVDSMSPHIIGVP